MQGNRSGVKPFVVAMARRAVVSRGGRRANAGAAGINRRHNLHLFGTTWTSRRVSQKMAALMLSPPVVKEGCPVGAGWFLPLEADR